jgi:putative ABC transport system substrate-binding protein
MTSCWTGSVARFGFAASLAAPHLTDGAMQPLDHEGIAGLWRPARPDSLRPPAAWPLAASAQPARRPARIGLFGSDNQVMGPATDAFLEDLGKAGFVAGQNLVVDRRSTEQDLASLTAQAAEMARAGPDALVALGAETSLQACVQASRDIPIVFVANNYDPIARGYVKSLARPGGNATGVFLRQTELAEKQVELLTKAIPGRTRLALLWDFISADQFDAAERRARLLGLEAQSHKLADPPYDMAAAFRNIAAERANMLLVLSSQFIARQREQVVARAADQRLPAMFIFKAYVQSGGLMSYGADNIEMYRQAAPFVVKILNGAKPADLPVEQPNRFELAINLKTAKAIGIELPTEILIRADEVIE